MFIELSRLLSQATTLLIIAAPIEGGRIRLTITPKSTKDSETTLVPVTVEGTPQELDAELPAALENFTAKTLSLIESSARFDAEIENAKKEKAAEAEASRKARNTKAAPTAKSTAPTTTPAPVPEKTEETLFPIEAEAPTSKP